MTRGIRGLTDTEVSLPGPVAWPDRSRDARVLQLVELSILRRLADGQRSVDIARAMRLEGAYVRQVRKRLRDTFGVADDGALLAHPEVVAQMEPRS